MGHINGCQSVKRTCFSLCGLLWKRCFLMNGKCVFWCVFHCTMQDNEFQIGANDVTWNDGEILTELERLWPGSACCRRPAFEDRFFSRVLKHSRSVTCCDLLLVSGDSRSAGSTRSAGGSCWSCEGTETISRFDSRGTSWTSYLKLVNLLMNHLPATSWNVPMHAQTLHWGWLITVIKAVRQSPCQWLAKICFYAHNCIL